MYQMIFFSFLEKKIKSKNRKKTFTLILLVLDKNNGV